ncbi:MAG: hydrolase [Sulfurimonas sp.]|nr:hydrolase [Sulfurimonas sp.]
MTKSFKPTFFMKNRHMQTLYSSFFRKGPEVETLRERLILEDGDFLDLNFSFTSNTNANTPFVILFHGLTGSYKSPYIRGIMDSFCKNGFNTVLMHFRSCSEELNNLERSYHSGETGDALFCLKEIQKRYPDAPLYAVGYSLGGNMLLKLLGELGVDSPLKAAVSVSAPLQLDVCADAINKGFSRIYQMHLMQNLKKTLKKKYAKHDMESLLRMKEKDINTLKTFWDFDGIYTAPIHGFKSAQDYYTKSSSKQYLKNIHTPTLIIHAKDDPFMNDTILPSPDEISDSIVLEISLHGGHVGFIEGSLFHPKYWLETRILKFFLQKFR